MIHAAIQPLSALFKGSLKKAEPMARHTTFRVGGPCDLYIEPESLDDLRIAVSFLATQGIPLTMVGDGSNLLVHDAGIDGAVINLSSMGIDISETTTETGVIWEVPAGMKTQHLCRHAAAKGFGGLQFATGIPGTLGGALAMNASTGRQGWEQVVTQLTVVERSGTMRTLPAAELDFDYRHLSIGSTDRLDGEFPIIVSARINLTAGESETLVSQRDESLSKRTASQPVSLPSAGCFYKNPADGLPAGKLIDELGLKGTVCGGARVSELHANYIVNTGSATADEILTLAERIERAVREAHGVTLEREVTLVGRQA